jgi:hypothetical protein
MAIRGAALPTPREIYEKRKADDQPEPSSFVAKDRVTLSVSLVALTVSILGFVVSGGNFYLASIRQTERVSVFFERLPTFVLGRGRPRQLEISDHLAVVFINSGTRPVAVVGATLYLQETSTMESMEFVDWCTKREKNRKVFRQVKLAFESLIIKEKEIVRRAFAIQGPAGNKVSLPVPSWADDFLKERNIDDDSGYWVNPCIEFKLTTPSAIVAGEAVELPTMYHFLREGKVAVSNEVDSSTPFEIWKSSGTIFD